MNKFAEMYEKERYLTNTIFTENEQLKRKITKLEKALDKACEQLERGYDCCGMEYCDVCEFVWRGDAE